MYSRNLAKAGAARFREHIVTERRKNAMKIIISPAKKMVVDTDSLKAEGTPCFLDGKGAVEVQR